MNYGEYKSALKEWSHRPDLSDATLDIMESLVRSRLGRELKLKENVVTLPLSITAAGYQLPGYIKRILQVQRQSDKLSYKSVTAQQIVFNRQNYHYCIEGDRLFLDYPGDVNLIAFCEPEQISASDADTNDVITQWPSIYLYAGLVEIARYYQDNELLDYFNAQLVTEIRQANKQASIERTGNAPAMRAV